MGSVASKVPTVVSKVKEYDPKFDYFKLITAKTHKNSICIDIILYFY